MEYLGLVKPKVVPKSEPHWCPLCSTHAQELLVELSGRDLSKYPAIRMTKYIDCLKFLDYCIKNPTEAEIELRKQKEKKGKRYGR